MELQSKEKMTEEQLKYKEKEIANLLNQIMFM